jgi:hypothetical protein
MAEPQVLLVQCLCPQRHAILAAASDLYGAELLTTSLREQLRRWLETGTINPWCGLCGAPRETWTYEVGVTRYRTMAEAEPALRQLEAEQIRSAAVLKALGLAYDAPPGEDGP